MNIQRTMMRPASIILSGFILSSFLISNSQASESASSCAALTEPEQRLSCYDAMFNAPAFDMQSGDIAPDYSSDTAYAYLERTWELSQEAKTGTFRFRPYQPNAILLWRNSDHPNRLPATPTQTTVTPLSTLPYELNFQLSFKTKLWQNMFQSPVDLWFAYTQLSFWQIYSSDISSPFRETNYEPEFMLTIPVHTSIAGLNLKVLNIGFSHQSNGRARPFSRSWNRLYMQTILEKGNFLLSIRAWQRIREQLVDDDNPDIGLYMGSGDIRATWINDESAVSALARYSLESNRGALKLNWSFPLRGHLKGYAELFTGYGDSLIDYNHKQSIAGLGLLISTWP